MILQPVALAPRGNPAPVGPGLRGVAIHWLAPDVPVSPEGKKFRPTVPELSWHLRIVPFRALNDDLADRPPVTVVETQRMVRHAYAIAAVHNPIPSDSTVYYEVGTWQA